MTAARKPTHHPDCYTLMRFAAGNLSAPMRLLVDSHLELCPHCRQELQAYETEAGLGLEALTPEEMDVGCLENLMHKIDESGPPTCIDVTIPVPQKVDGRFPEALRHITGLKGEKIQWSDAGAQMEKGVTATSASSYCFLRIKAGQSDAKANVDMMLVLEGVLHMDGMRYGVGDIVRQRHVKKARAESDALCLVVTPAREDKPNIWDIITRFFSGCHK